MGLGNINNFNFKALIAYNTLSQVATKFVGAISTFIITVIIARSYGINIFGDFVKISSYVAMFYMISDFGMNAIYLQENVKESSSINYAILYKSRLYISVIVTFLAVSILVFIPRGYAQGFTNSVRLGILIFAPSVIFQGILTSANGLFQKKLRYDLSTLAVFAGSIVALVGVYLIPKIFLPGSGLIFSIISLLTGSAVTAVMALKLAKNLEPIQTIVAFKENFRTLLFKSLPLALTLVFNLVYFRIDTFIMTLSRPTAEVGFYGLAYKVFEVALVVPTFFMNSIYPSMLKIHTSDNRDNFKWLIKKTAYFLTIASFLLLFLFWAGAPFLTMIRPEFSQSVLALRLLILSLPLFFLSSLTMWMLIVIKSQKSLVYIYGSAMILNILLNIYFIPKYGYLAAAIITGITEIYVLGISSFKLLFINQKQIKI